MGARPLEPSTFYSTSLPMCSRTESRFRSSLRAPSAAFWLRSFSACKACADELGLTEMLEQLGIELIYWGEPLTELLPELGTLLSV